MNDTQIKRAERVGGSTVPFTHKYPQVRGGTCEWCGVKDPNYPAHLQYTLCDHFKNMGELMCSYCDASKNPEDVVYKHILNIHDSPTNPGAVVVVCDNYTCSQKHLARFRVNNV